MSTDTDDAPPVSRATRVLRFVRVAATTVTALVTLARALGWL